MIADTRKELMDMVRIIGVQKKWIQEKDTPHEHFDICLSKKMKALKASAIEISFMELGRKTATRKLTKHYYEN